MIKNISKTILFIGIIIIFSSSFIQPAFSQGEKILNLKTAMSLAKNRSEDLNLIKLDLLKKNVERRQAKEGLDDIRKKESTVRFSLLFDIEFPETHGMPKEIELILKLPKIDNDIEKLNMEYVNKIDKLNFDVKSLYYDILDSEALVNHTKKVVSDLEITYKDLYLGYLKGTVNKDDLKLIEDSLKSNKDSLTKNILKFETTKAKLTDLIGIDLRKNYKFDNEIVDIKLSRNDLKEFISYGLEHDYQLLTAKKDRKLAEKEVSQVYEIYKDWFGSKVKIIDSEINKSPMDYVSLYKKYESMLEKIDKKWKKIYVINMLFFKIKIPMRWFQGEYTALRYFEDQKYPLIVAISERDKKREQEKKIFDSIEPKIKVNYDVVKQIELALKQSQTELVLQKKEFELLKEKNLLGKVDFASVQEAKFAIESLELSIFQGKIGKSKAIASLDFSSSGAVTKTFASEEYISGDYGSGISIMNEDSENKNAIWYLKTPYENYKFIFGVNIPKEIGVTGYRLFNNKGIPLSSITPITETIEHLPLVFEENELLYLLFYEKDKIKYKSLVKGDNYQGNLEFISMDKGYIVNDKIGNYKIEKLDDLKATLLVVTNKDIQYDFYQLVDLDGKVISKSYKKGEIIESLDIILSNIKEFRIQLLAGETIYTLELLPTGDEGLEGLLLMK